MFKKRVVIIEDDTDLRSCLELIVNSSEKFLVSETFSDGETAIKSLDKKKPDIALVDLELPGISGIEAIKLIKTKSPKTECIIVTVYEILKWYFKD